MDLPVGPRSRLRALDEVSQPTRREREDYRRAPARPPEPEPAPAASRGGGGQGVTELDAPEFMPRRV